MARIARIEPRTRHGKNVPLIALGVTTVAASLSLATHVTGQIYLFLLISVVAFGCVVWLELRERRLTARQVTICAAILMVLAMVFPMRTSRDVWAYADYGQMLARYDASPYTHVPADFPQDFWFDHVSERWQETGSVYGPLFAATAGIFMEFTGDSMLATRLAFQLFAAAVVAFMAWLIWRRTKDPLALALLLVNPVVMVSVVNGGHNDPLVGLGILGAVMLVERRKAGLAGGVIALGALVKVVALLPAAAIAYWLWRRRSTRDVGLFALVCGAVFVAGTAFAGGLDVFQPLREASKLVSFSSFWHAILKVASGGTFQGPGVVTGHTIVRIASGIVVVALATTTMIVMSRHSTARATTTAVTVGYMLAAPYVLPWYAIWVLPLCALTWRSRLSLVAIVHSSVLTLAIFPLSDRTIGWVRAIRAGIVGMTGPLEIAAMAALLVVAVRRHEQPLARAA